MNFAGKLDRARAETSPRTRAGETPAPRSALVEDSAREYLLVMVAVIVACVIGFLIFGGTL
jgi:hypothetical protein